MNKLTFVGLALVTFPLALTEASRPAHAQPQPPALSGAAGSTAAAPPTPAKPAPTPAKPAPAATASPTPTKPATPTPTAAPAAASPAMPPTPKPAPELETLKVFLGKWKCEGKAAASPMFGAEHAIKASAEAKLESDNFWQSFTYEEKKTKEHPGLKMKGLWGYDQGSKRYVRAAAGSHGEWDTASAPGWEGEKLTWTGELSGPMGRVPFHHIFAKKSDKEWVQVFEVRGPDGKWFQTEEVTCKK